MESFPSKERIKRWIEENGPNGAARLALKIGVSVSLVHRAQRGEVPKKSSTRKKFVDFFKARAGDGEAA